MVLVLILTSFVMMNFVYPNLFNVGWQIWTLGITLPFAAFALGYVLARVCRQPYSCCRAIGFETGCQNAAVALSLIGLTFPREPGYSQFPVLYSIFMTVDNFLIVVLHVIYFRIKDRKKKSVELDSKEAAEIKTVSIYNKENHI